MLQGADTADMRNHVPEDDRRQGGGHFIQDRGQQPFFNRVVDPITLNSDPDPECWPNLDPNPGVCYQF